MKVEVFKMTEYANDRGSDISFLNYENHSNTDMGLSQNMDISRYPVRTIKQCYGISSMAPKEIRDEEIKRLSMRGFSLRDRDPYVISMVKEKKFVIADEDINSAFEDIEKNNHKTDFSKRSCNLLIIDQTNDINKLTYELNSQSEVIDNYREEYCRLENRYSHLKSMNIFQRIFMWKKS